MGYAIDKVLGEMYTYVTEVIESFLSYKHRFECAFACPSHRWQGRRPVQVFAWEINVVS